MKKKISILGSTGSIGVNTLKIIDKKKIYSKLIFLQQINYDLICNQIKRFNPKVFLINDFKIYSRVKKNFQKKSINY